MSYILKFKLIFNDINSNLNGRYASSAIVNEFIYFQERPKLQFTIFIIVFVRVNCIIGVDQIA